MSKAKSFHCCQIMKLNVPDKMETLMDMVLGVIKIHISNTFPL